MNVIDLSLGDPAYGPPEEAKLALCNMMGDSHFGYTEPSGLRSLREAIAAKLQKRNRIPATYEQVGVTTGASLGLFSIAAVICKPGDVVLVPDPGYPGYQSLGRLQQLRLVSYPLRRDCSYEPDWNVISRFAAHARLLVWNFPSNPIGVVARRDWFRPLFEILDDNANLYLISDEVYEDLLFGGQHHSPAAYRASMAERTFSLFSFSKGYGMTGWRVGYVHAREDWIRKVSRAHWAAGMSAPTPAQHIAEAVLKVGPEYSAQILRFLEQNRKQAVAAFRAWGIDQPEPDAGFFLWADISQFSSDTNLFVEQIAQETRVILSPPSWFGSLNTSHVRLSLAVDPSVLADGLERLGRFLQNQRTTM